MAKLHDLNLKDWNTMLEAFNGESDRGAAVLAGGFVENYLGVYLRSMMVDPELGAEVLNSLGPVGSFGSRAAIARAFGFIPRYAFDDLTLIRKIRNHFAHHPFDAHFDVDPVRQYCEKLSELVTAKESGVQTIAERNRRAYMFTCGLLCGQFQLQMEKKKSTGDED